VLSQLLLSHLTLWQPLAAAATSGGAMPGPGRSNALPLKKPYLPVSLLCGMDGRQNLYHLARYTPLS